MKFLKRSERDFNVCSDCTWFQFTEYIDKNYPVKYGKCHFFNKIVDDRWEVKCSKFKSLTCEQCKYYRVYTSDYFDDDYGEVTCTKLSKSTEPFDQACDYFEEN